MLGRKRLQRCAHVQSQTHEGIIEKYEDGNNECPERGCQYGAHVPNRKHEDGFKTKSVFVQCRGQCAAVGRGLGRVYIPNVDLLV
jgi:hypothetical protein